MQHWFDHPAVRDVLVTQAVNTIGARKILLAQDEESQDIYILLHGHVKISYYTQQGKVTHIALMQAPESFGELAALDGLPRSATVETQTVCKYQMLSSTIFNTLLKNHNDLSRLIILDLAEKLRNTSRRLIEVQNYTVLERLAQDIMRHANASGFYHSALSQEEWAQTLDVSRETLARNLSYFEKENIITRHGRDISIVDEKRLQAFADTQK